MNQNGRMKMTALRIKTAQNRIFPMILIAPGHLPYEIPC